MADLITTTEEETIRKIGTSSDTSAALAEAPYVTYDKERYNIVSTMAYLMGVPDKYFNSEKTMLKQDRYNELEKDKNARLMRDLTLVRSSIQKNHGRIVQELQDPSQFKSLTNTEHVPQDSVKRLEEAHINLHSQRKNINGFQIVLNREIQSRISICKGLFPKWINWEYVKDLFIVPNGTKEEGIKESFSLFKENGDRYPFHTYINWVPVPEDRYIMVNDKIFVTELYEKHGDRFENMNLVRDVDGNVKNRIYDFIDKAEKLVFMVDCENSDPYSLCTAIKGLDPDKLKKVSKIILYDDVHAPDTWDMMQTYVGIPVEYILTHRVKDDKSLVDVKLIAGTCQEHYENKVDSFVIASSDSDYWGLIESLPNANFLVMIEHDKCSGKLKEALKENGTFYCYIDDFYTKDSGSTLKEAALMREATNYFKEYKVNLQQMMDEVIFRTRAKLTEAEKESFIKNRLEKPEMITDKEGNLVLEPRKGKAWR